MKENQGWFRQTLSFDGVAAIAFAIAVIVWLVRIDERSKQDHEDIGQLKLQFVAVSEGCHETAAEVRALSTQLNSRPYPPPRLKDIP